MMKKSFVFLFFALLQQALWAQSFVGIVLDSNAVPIPYANVCLLNSSDSSFISGVVTELDGRYSISKPINLQNQNLLIRVSSVGFETLFLQPNLESTRITLQEDVRVLDEVLVSAKSRPAFKMEKGTLRVGVQNSLLENLGNAIEVIGNLPFVSSSGNSLSVFGRGTPHIYIDNRRVYNLEELLRLSSEEIKNMELILNPGASYGSDVKAVIRVRTLRKGEGLSSRVTLRADQKRHFNGMLFSNLNYRHRRWDFFGALVLGRTKSSNNSRQRLQFQNQDAFVDVDQQFFVTQNNQSLASSLGFNYSDYPNHEFGVKYEFSRIPLSKARTTGTSYYHENGFLSNQMAVDLGSRTTQDSHQLNAYYAKKVAESTELKVNLDYLEGSNLARFNALQTSEGDVQTNKSTKYQLYIAKAELSTPLWGGAINYGAEAAYTKNKQAYEVIGANSMDGLAESEDLNKQLFYSLFASQSFNLAAINVDLGARFETVSYRYYHLGQFEDEPSKTYSRLSPFIQINYDINKISMSLSYRNSIRRPPYGMLNNSVVFTDAYTYERGNSKLRSSYEDRLNAVFSWKDFALDITHTWHTNSIHQISQLMNNKNAVLFTYENLALYREWAADLTYTPTLGIWRPSASLGLSKQLLSYKGQSYNKPSVFYELSNLLQIAPNINLYFDFWGTSNSNTSLTEFKAKFRANTSLNVQFLNKQLSLWVKLSDIFGTDREHWESRVNGISFSRNNKLDTRGILFQISYSFNTQQSKYKGAASNPELTRVL